jgi:hypothetical protein
MNKLEYRRVGVIIIIVVVVTVATIAIVTYAIINHHNYQPPQLLTITIIKPIKLWHIGLAGLAPGEIVIVTASIQR